MTTFDAILPAGGTLDPELAAQVGAQNKALIPIGGQTVLRRTIEALRGTGRVNRIVLVGTDEVRNHPDAALATDLVTSGTSGPDTIFRGLKHLAALPDAPSQVLIVTADLPFLTPEIIRSFLEKCPPEAEVCVPLATKEEYQARFPGSGATFIPLKDNAWTAGCAYVMNVAAFTRALPDLERLFLVRKSKIGMIRLLGAKFLFKYLTKTLVLQDVESKIVSLLGCSGRAILSSPPELAFDIDDLEDYQDALKHLGTR